MLRGAKHLNAARPKPSVAIKATPVPPLIPPHQLMMAGPSFGLGETAAPRKRGDTPSPFTGRAGEGHTPFPFTGRAGEGLARKLLNITQASLVAVSPHAGERPPSDSPARGGGPLLIPPHAGECPASDSPAFGMAHQRGERERSPLLIIRPTPGGGPCPCLALSCDRCRRRRPGRPGR